jgi:hypothetical protein
VSSATALIVALTGLITAIGGILALLVQVRRVHQLVNNQLDRQLSYNGQLARALTSAGIPVPRQDPPGSGEAGERLQP